MTLLQRLRQKKEVIQRLAKKGVFDNETLEILEALGLLERRDKIDSKVRES